MSTSLRHYYRGQRLVTMVNGLTNAKSTYHFDYQGTTQALTESTGTVTDRFAADAWGVRVKRTGSSPNRQWYVGNAGYAGDGYYAELGGFQALYIRRRYYGAGLARFMSLDPIRIEVNLYVYTRNAASRFVDPSGAICSDEAFKKCFRPETRDRLNALLSTDGCRKYLRNTYGRGCSPDDADSVMDFVCVVEPGCAGRLGICDTKQENLLETSCIPMRHTGGPRTAAICIGSRGDVCDWHADAQAHILLHEWLHVCQCGAGWDLPPSGRPNKFENCACQAMKRCGVPDHEIKRHVDNGWCSKDFDAVDCSEPHRLPPRPSANVIRAAADFRS